MGKKYGKSVAIPKSYCNPQGLSALYYLLVFQQIISRILSYMGFICTDNIFVYVDAFVMLVGFVIEAAADIQKSNAKKKNSKRFVDTGLYRLVRCPNYFGEMLFWTGTVVSGIGAISGWQWLIVALGYMD